MKTIGLAVAVLLVLTPAAFAFEPMPPIMQTLLEIFPEKNGWFVDEPLGAVPGTPEEAKPFFECFRVIVPDLESLDKAIGRLMANAPKLPIKKITRYDREPGAPGLAGFRGIWCKTEDESLVGFAIVTVNQNRFLLWARQGYYPSFAVDSINAKVRDQYARDVSRYLAGVDAKVPDNETPQAAGRMLPEWMDLYPRSSHRVTPDDEDCCEPEIRAWGLHNVLSFVPTEAGIREIIAAAKDTLWPHKDSAAIQHEFQAYLGTACDSPRIRSLTHEAFLTLRSGHYGYAVDRYGRIRFANLEGCTDSTSPGLPEGQYVVSLYLDISEGLLFPGQPVLTAGEFGFEAPDVLAAISYAWVSYVNAASRCYFYCCASQSPESEADVPPDSDKYLESVGHFLNALKGLGVKPAGMTVCKSSRRRP